MLTNLTIKNVALISDAEIDFSSGLNVLSGETGAGKSVILDSLNFVLGAKADKTMIRHGEQYCLVCCTFENYPTQIDQILQEYDIERSEQLIIRRKFDLNGNANIKVNGENVTATMLKKITAYLVDVHGQSEHFSLLSKTRQLDVIDDGAKCEKQLEELKQITHEIKEIDAKLLSLGGDPSERAKKLDLLQYQINEIQASELKDGEEEDLKLTKNKILNAEKLTQSLSQVCSALSDENGATDILISAEHALKGISSISEDYNSLLKRLLSVREEISDISETASDLLDSVDCEYIDVDEIEQRLELYKSLKRKYGATVSDIYNYLDQISLERENLLNFENNSQKLREEKLELTNKWYKKCLQLSKTRKEFCKGFSKRVTEKLAQLGMPSAVFKVEFEDIPSLEQINSYTSSGLDKIEFVFSANAGEPVKPLSKIISGGEMSRFMLALKTQTGSICQTYVFDEIDAGLSGITASIVAKNFAEIAKNRQIIAISHLPQITAMSDNSLFIEKVETNGKTYTKVNALTFEQKRNEILRLIGGKFNDETAIKHAENMILEAENYKKTI